MLVYHAGNNTNKIGPETFLYAGVEQRDLSVEAIERWHETFDLGTVTEPLVKHRLLTYAELESIPDVFDYWLEPDTFPGKRVFIDCGAYSVHMRGAEIDLDEYMTFVREKAGHADVVCQLDVVGNPAETRRNLETMQREGLSPLPVYTAAAEAGELERLCERYDYIALGGMRGREAGVREWQRRHLDQVFTVAMRYWPVKFHVFGITAQWVLEEYPVYSVDSSVAIVGGSHGRVAGFRVKPPQRDDTAAKLVNLKWYDHARLEGDGAVADNVSAATAYMGRRLRSAMAMVSMETYATRLWAARGVSWDDEGRYTGCLTRR